MGHGLLESLDLGGQIAVVVSAVAGDVYVYVSIPWKPRHLSHRREHDCRSLGCLWPKEPPR